MNSGPSDGAVLLAGLESCEDFPGLYQRFSNFLRPFGEFFFLENYNPGFRKKKTGKRKNFKDLPGKEKIRPIAKQFHQFLCNTLKLLPDLLKRCPSEEGIDEERGAELLSIYRLTIHCLICIAPCLTGQPYSVHLQWGQLVRRLESWGMYSEAEEEGFAILESIRSMLLTSTVTLKSPGAFLPDPSVVGSAGEDPQLACLVTEVVIVLTNCIFKSQLTDKGAYERILELVEQVKPWLGIMEPKAMASRHAILVDSLHRCALFLAKECTSVNVEIVQPFCISTLRECIDSALVDRFPIMAHRICSSIDPKWERWTSLVVDMLKMSMEISFKGYKVNIAIYVDGFLYFVANSVERFYLALMNSNEGDSVLSFEDAGYPCLASTVLELCCKTMWLHIDLLCQSQIGNSTKYIQDNDASNDLTKVLRDIFTKSARLIDILYKCGAPNAFEILARTISELSVVEVSVPNLSLSFPLVKQWVKMLCRDFNELNTVDSAPFLYSLLLRHSPALPKKILVEILQQELLAYEQLEALNPTLCQKMGVKIIDYLLTDVLTTRDFCQQRSHILVRKAMSLRALGLEMLSLCLECLGEAISLLDGVSYDSSDENILEYHQLALAYFLRAHFSHEANYDWELIRSDIHCAINLLLKIDFVASQSLNNCLKIRAKSTISMLCLILDLLSLKGFLNFHCDLYKLVNMFCMLENVSVDKILIMLWTGRRLSHSLCTSPIDVDFISKMPHNPANNPNSIAFWKDSLSGSSYALLMFVQKLFLSHSILSEENIQLIESLYSCKLSVEEVEIVTSSVLSDVSAKNEMAFIAGYIYYDLSERLFSGGRVLEALSYAKEALSLRYKVLRKKFSVSNKKPAKLAESPIATKVGADYLHLELLGSAINEVWQDICNLDRCLLSPWGILNCYLESILQVGILQEETGDGVEAEKLFHAGKRFSSLQCLPILGIAFNCALGQLYCKKMLWDVAEDELKSARKLLQENDMMISCMHCKLALEVKIDMQIGDIYMGRLKRGSHVQFHALDMYRSALKKLSNENVETSLDISLKQEYSGMSTRKCHLEDTKHRVEQNCDLHSSVYERKLPVCSICSFLKKRSDACDSRKLFADSATVLPPETKGGESHVKMEIKKTSRNGSSLLSKEEGILNSEPKPRRSSRNRSFNNKCASATGYNESHDAKCALHVDIDYHKKILIRKSGSQSSDSGFSNGCFCDRMKCLRCLIMKTLKEGTMQNIIYFKWQCQRRCLLLNVLLNIVECLQVPGEKHEEHDVHCVFWQCISVLFDGRPCLISHSHEYDLNLIKIIGGDNLGDIFSAERAALLYSMSWFFLKDMQPESRSARCCSLSNVQMNDIISWLLRAFILCREIPILFQKVSRLIAAVTLLSTVDGSISPELCSSKSLSLNHWAAFFHQASIGTVVYHQYLSFVRNKVPQIGNGFATQSKAGDITRPTLEKLESLGQFVEGFFHGLPRISMVCISLLGGDYANLLGEVLILPSFFPAWLLVTRLDANCNPIIMFLPADFISEGIQNGAISFKELICETKDFVSEWPCPWDSAVIDEIAPSYKLILEENFSSLSIPAFSEAGERLNYHWWSCRKILDSQLDSLLKTMENAWFGTWGCLLLGERLDIQFLETVATRLTTDLNVQCNFGVNDNLIKVILGGAQSFSGAEKCISQLLLYRGYFGRGGCCGEQRFRAFSTSHSDEVKCILTAAHSLISEAIGKAETVDRQPVILVLDTDVQMIPWENMPVLKNQEVYRMPSVGSILLKLNWRHQYHERDREFEIDLPSIDPFHAYYLLNPSGDLNHTQQEFEEWFRNQKWQGKVGDIPTTEELVLALQNHDLFLYFGHGSGMQYIRLDEFRKLHRCAAAFLMGCSSGSLKQRGNYAPHGAPLHYLFAGSPSIIANLWDVSDKDIDRFAKTILNSWIQDSISLNSCEKCSKSADLCSMSINNEGSNTLCRERRTRKVKEISEKDKCKHCEAKLRVASFIGQARGACRLSTLIGASVVCYGVPTILKRRL